MFEKDIIKNLKKLRKTKPCKNWVFLNKRELLEDKELLSFSVFDIMNKSVRFAFAHKPFFACFLVFAFMFGIAAVAQNALPGDNLYTVKRAVEKAQFTLKPGSEPKLSFEIAQRRLNELNRVVESSSVRNLAPAINEFQESVSNIAKNIEKSEVKEPKLVAEEITKIEKEREKIRSLGIEIAENEDFDRAKSNIYYRASCEDAKEMIEFGKTRTLTEHQAGIFVQMKEFLKQGKCEQVIEMWLVDFQEPQEPKQELENEEEANEEQEESIENKEEEIIKDVLEEGR